MQERDKLINEYEKVDLLYFAMIGSVDDGKSTLIGRLLYDCKGIYDDQYESIKKDSKKLNRDLDFALLTDGLKVEREQGITVDVAYRYFLTNKRRFIIIDTPGHVQYTKNMATGTSLANVAVILVDARNGILRQTKIHTFISSLFGVKRVVLAVNKMDLVNWDEQIFNKITLEFKQFCQKLGFTEICSIPISAILGDNIVSKSKNMKWYNGASLIEYLENVSVDDESIMGANFRFPVQLVSRPNPDFRGYMGTIVSGCVQKGDNIIILPSMQKSKVESIVTYEKSINEAYSPMSVSLTIEDNLDISRGNVIIGVGSMPIVDNLLEANIIWFSEKKLNIGDEFLIKHLYSTTKAFIEDIKYVFEPDNLSKDYCDSVEINQVACIRLKTYKDIIFEPYSINKSMGNFILIDKNDNNTVAAGMILNKVKEVKISETDLKNKNLQVVGSKVNKKDREKSLGHKSATIWLIGLSASGKSTIAIELEKRLFSKGCLAFVFDGDNLRSGLNNDLGFSVRDRLENLRRSAEVAKLYNMSGGIAIVSFITPLEESRKMIREIIGNGYIEVFCDASIETCKKRDPKGLYKKALDGEISEFTGISSPFEMPINSHITINTEVKSVKESVDIIMEYLKKKGIV